MIPGVRRRHRLGGWEFPSGRKAEAFVLPARAGAREIAVEWSDPPPLDILDDLYYRAVVRPAILRLAAEYLELVAAAALVVEA